MNDPSRYSHANQKLGWKCTRSADHDGPCAFAPHGGEEGAFLAGVAAAKEAVKKAFFTHSWVEVSYEDFCQGVDEVLVRVPSKLLTPGDEP